MATAARKQDMPPPGGYKRIIYERNPARTYFSGYQMIAAYVGITAASCYVYYLTCKEIEHDEVEMRSGRFALAPMLTAERDREYLKQLRRNRDEEASLMANVKGWEVGTWFGEPVFKTLPADKLMDPTFNEFYVHTSYKEFAKRAMLKHWT
ncbi:NADH dehydrogenase [ubiquinone] 1 alpha subcomplex subunit 13 [Pseudolycoriella hygida]|uniref:NADH dehydrogenase [ubiquinone] 1 alpha subcomplex subunit 13 n=1 Tax=Pseudolycoriella hygida TaxID=35572 RepID=A0A9Q0S8F6_9DIPT|nr:NADH dehydrogenase [ubiquinone] 1 alpha subcomplex subunit 13 [Pseudolycoriella hygida]